MTLCNYLTGELDRQVYVSYIISVMRNYTCAVNDYISKNIKLRGNDVHTHIYLDKLSEVLRKEKSYESKSAPEMNEIYSDVCGRFRKCITEVIMDYLPYTIIKISEITNNPELYPGRMLLKFHRPIPEKNNKKITVKLQYGGIVNLDGCNSEIEAVELYYWLQYMFQKYWDIIMFDPSKIKNIEYSSDDGYESLYDDDMTVIHRRNSVNTSV
jgi:hypothetical protein